MSFVERHKTQPFFLYLAFNAVHAPLQAPADEIAKFDTGNTDRNTLLAMGKRMDDAIGNLVSTLKKEGVWENTLLFFIGDNGGPLAQTADNTPLRGGKHQDYEGGVRVPFLVCWPGSLTPGESQAVVSSLDILPTTLAAAGISPPVDKPFDGINMLPVLRGESAPTPRDLFWCAGGEEGWWAIRSGDWKPVGDKGRIELFDLSQDVSEKQDLAQQMPEKLAELTALHDAWLAEMANPIKGGAKRYGMEEAGKKKSKGEKKPKRSRAASDAAMPATNGAVRESFAKLTVDKTGILKKVQIDLALDTWHKLTLKCDGPELFGELDETTVIATDEVFYREKSEVDFLASGGTVGLRNFSLTPIVSYETIKE